MTGKTKGQARRPFNAGLVRAMANVAAEYFRLAREAGANGHATTEAVYRGMGNGYRQAARMTVRWSEMP